jgi:hypothetical protein
LKGWSSMEPWVCYRRPEGGAYACSGSERCSYGVTGSCFSGDGFTRCFSDSWSEFHDFFGKGESLILSGPNASERRKAAGILQERLAKDEIEWAEVGSICCHGLVTPTYSIAPLTEGSVDIKFYCDEDGKRYVVDIFGCDYFSVIDRRGTGRPRQGVRCQLLRWYVHALRRVRRH